MKRKKTSITVNPALWKKAKLFCVDQGLELSDYVEGLIRKDLSEIDEVIARNTGK